MNSRLVSEKTVGAMVLLCAGLLLGGTAQALATFAWVIIALETVSVTWIQRANAVVTEAVLAASALVVAVVELLASRGQEFGNQQIGLLAAGAAAIMLLVGASRSAGQA